MFVKGGNKGHIKAGALTNKNPPIMLGKLYSTEAESIIILKGVIMKDVSGKGTTAPQLTLLNLDSTAVTKAGTHGTIAKGAATPQLALYALDCTADVTGKGAAAPSSPSSTWITPPSLRLAHMAAT